MYVYICFSLIFVPKANADDGVIMQVMCSYHQRNQSISWMMVWQWHHFLLTSNTIQVQPKLVYARSH